MGCGRSFSRFSVEKTNLKENRDGSKSKPNVKDKKALTAENTAFTDTMNFLGNVPLFKTLPKDQTPMLASACEHMFFKLGQTVIKEGDEGTEFFCIQSGEATVMVGHKTVATLKSGDYFGEASLLRDEPRTATVIAITELRAFKITREKFQALGLNDQLHFVNRKAVGHEKAGGRNIEVRPPSPKTNEEKADMYKGLESNANLKMMNLDSNMMNQMIDVAWRQDVTAGTALITQGDLNADYFYVVQEGTFEIFVKKDKDKGDGKAVGVMSKGASFGELALLYVVPRAATVKCKKNGVVWVIDRQNFKQIMMKKSEDKITECVKLLDRVEGLNALSSEEKAKLSKALVEVHFKSGESIIKQGAAGSAFYILVDGEVAVVKDDKEVARLDAVPAKMTAQFFGEGALLNDEKRAATIKVVSPSAKVLALDREDFNIILGPLKELMKAKDTTRQKTAQLDKKGSSQDEGSSSSKKKGNPKLKSKSTSGKSKTASKLESSPPANEATNDAPKEKILFAELKVLGLLGCGGFGAVELVEHVKTGESYALKAVSKGYIVQTGMKDSISNEKMILSMTNSPFIVRLFECYNSPQNIYFLLEPALGGELYATYNRKGFHGKEGHAKYYTAGVVYAFEHCHIRHIIYRDLKPENLLLTAEGKVKLTDMGLAKFVVGTTFTTCGTPDYFAPELVQSEGHTVAVDWWCLGILIYELMGGNPPFESDQPMQTYKKVVDGIDKVSFAKKCQGVVETLIKALLRPKPAERIPMRPGGTKNIMDHEWYKDFDWKAMQQGSLEPPYMPTVKSKTDMKNFHARAEEKPPQMHYKDDGTGWDKDFATST